MNLPAVSSYLTSFYLSLPHSLARSLSPSLPPMQSFKHHGNLLGGIGCQETGFAPHCMLTKVAVRWGGYNQQDCGELEACGTGALQLRVCWRQRLGGTERGMSEWDSGSGGVQGGARWHPKFLLLIHSWSPSNHAGCAASDSESLTETQTAMNSY